MTRQMHLGSLSHGVGGHVAGWRMPGAHSTKEKLELGCGNVASVAKSTSKTLQSIAQITRRFAMLGRIARSCFLIGTILPARIKLLFMTKAPMSFICCGNS